jgi:hypothetical protein
MESLFPENQVLNQVMNTSGIPVGRYGHQVTAEDTNYDE